MENLDLVVDILVVLAAALIGGLLAQLLRLPAILGYLLAGIVIGPHTPGPVSDVAQVQMAADVGIILLMFTLGVRFSFRELAAVRLIALIGGPLQILATIGLGLLVAPVLDLSTREALYLGAVLSLSSTMVALKLLESRGELDSLHGRVAVGLLIIQDLSVVPMVVILPATRGGGLEMLADLGIAAGKAAGLLLGTYLLGTRLLPWLLFRLAAIPVREIFLLALILLALGLSSLSLWAGLSLAFGAFLAGLAVSESEFSHQALAVMEPLQDIFATVFFVSMGMLIGPRSIWEDPLPVLLLAAIAAGGKFLIVGGLGMAFGYASATALGAGLALAQMGEFSFVLANIGVDEGIIDEGLNATVLGAILVTVLLSPLLLPARRPLAQGLAAMPLVGGLFAPKAEAHLTGPPEEMARHAVVCGYGQAGRELVDALARRDFRYLVVEYDPHTIRSLRRRGIPCVYGDISNRIVLEQCRLERARIMAITGPDIAAAQVAVTIAKGINPDLDVIVRGRELESHQALRQAGAAEVVHPEFEAGLEFVRHVLHRFGVPSAQIQAMLSRRRDEYYQA